MTDDAKLVKSAAKGDASALEQLVRRHGPAVHTLLSGLLAGASETADATEETFVRLARGISRYDSKESVERWVLSIARRVSADYRHAAPAMSPSWVALARLETDQREVLVLREMLGWDDTSIGEFVGCDAASVHDRLALARATAAMAARS